MSLTTKPDSKAGENNHYEFSLTSLNIDSKHCRIVDLTRENSMIFIIIETVIFIFSIS